MNIATTTRYLADGITVSNDTRITGLNNNDLIVGPSGTGKTGGYVVPNLQSLNGSMILAETKGNLSRKHAPRLRAAGYDVFTIDLVHPDRSDAYNPLDYVRLTNESPNTLDVTSLARAIVPKWGNHDHFWEDAATDLIALAIGVTMEMYPIHQRTMRTTAAVLDSFSSETFLDQAKTWITNRPNGFTASRLNSVLVGRDSEKMWASIFKIAQQAISPFDMVERRPIFETKSSFRMDDLGKQRTVVFLNISDIDRTSDYIANLFYSQALHSLCLFADSTPESRLPVPVRLVLDDFASSATIPDFDRIISVIRSRDIAVSIIIQSLSQLETLYSAPQAQTIINNCDHVLYLGGHDLQTAEYVAHRVGRTPETVMALPRTKAYLLTSGTSGRLVDKITPYSITYDPQETALDGSKQRSGNLTMTENVA